MGIKSISMTVEARYTTRPSEEERAVRIKSISIAAETYCTTKTLTASRRMKTIHKCRREQKQNDSTRNFNKSEQHHGTNTMAGQSRIQTVAGLHSSKTLVDIPNSPSTMAIHKRTAILNIQNHAKGYQDKHTGNHSPWQNPITSGINIQMKNCDKSQQHKRRPKPTTSITTHIAEMPKHATIKQIRIQKTTLRNEAYADVRRERRSHNFNNGGTQESRL
jgi:hypothetical protein